MIFTQTHTDKKKKKGLRTEYLMSVCSAADKIEKLGKVSHFQQLKTQMLDIGSFYVENSQIICLRNQINKESYSNLVWASDTLFSVLWLKIYSGYFSTGQVETKIKHNILYLNSISGYSLPSNATWPLLCFYLFWNHLLKRLKDFDPFHVNSEIIFE